MVPYTVHVHLKNLSRVEVAEQWTRTLAGEEGGNFRVVELADGIIDLEGMVRFLSECGYRGDFLIEYQGEDEPMGAVRNCVEQAEAWIS